MNAMSALLVVVWTMQAVWGLISLLSCIEILRHGGWGRGWPKISVKFALYDPWIGSFHDRAKGIWYVCPLPCVLLKIEQDLLASLSSVMITIAKGHMGLGDDYVCRIGLPGGDIASGHARTRWGARRQARKDARLMLAEMKK